MLIVILEKKKKDIILILILILILTDGYIEFIKRYIEFYLFIGYNLVRVNNLVEKIRDLGPVEE